MKHSGAEIENKMIYLSIVVPVRNEEHFIFQTLSQLVDQKYPQDRYEILVVDGMSSDNTRQIVREFIKKHPEATCRLFENPGFLSSCARNIGARAAKGEIIAFVDGHVFIPDNNLFENIEQIINVHKAECLARPQPLIVPTLEKGSTAYWIAAARHSWIGHSTKSYIYSDYQGFVDPASSGFAYKRQLFETVGFFDETFDAAEDVEFNYRISRFGVKAYTSPRLLIYYYPRESYLDLFQQQVRYGVGRARFINKHPEAFYVETLVPPVIFLLHISLPFIIPGAIFYPLFVGPLLFVAVLYWAVLLIAGFREAAKKQMFNGFPVALGTWITHMGLGWGFLKTAPGFLWKKRT